MEMAGCEAVFCITPPIVTNEVVFDGHTDASQDQESMGPSLFPDGSCYEYYY